MFGKFWRLLFQIQATLDSSLILPWGMEDAVAVKRWSLVRQLLYSHWDLQLLGYMVLNFSIVCHGQSEISQTAVLTTSKKNLIRSCWRFRTSHKFVVTRRWEGENQTVSLTWLASWGTNVLKSRTHYVGPSWRICWTYSPVNFCCEMFLSISFI